MNTQTTLEAKIQLEFDDPFALRVDLKELVVRAANYLEQVATPTLHSLTFGLRLTCRLQETNGSNLIYLGLSLDGSTGFGVTKFTSFRDRPTFDQVAWNVTLLQLWSGVLKMWSDHHSKKVDAMIKEALDAETGEMIHA